MNFAKLFIMVAIVLVALTVAPAAAQTPGSLSSFSCSLSQNLKGDVTGVKVSGSFVAQLAEPYAGYGFVEVNFNPGGVGAQVGKYFQLDLPYNFGQGLPPTPPPYAVALTIYATGETVSRQCASVMAAPYRPVFQPLTKEEVEARWGRSLPLASVELGSLPAVPAMPSRGNTGQGTAGVPAATVGLPPAELTSGQVWVYPTSSGVVVLMTEDLRGSLSFAAAQRVTGGSRVIFHRTSSEEPTAWVAILLADNGLVGAARHSTSVGFITGEKKDTMSVKFGFPVGSIYELNGIGSAADFVELEGVRLKWFAGGGQSSANGDDASWVGYFQQPTREGLLVAVRFRNGIAECDSRWYR